MINCLWIIPFSFPNIFSCGGPQCFKILKVNNKIMINYKADLFDPYICQ